MYRFNSLTRATKSQIAMSLGFLALNNNSRTFSVSLPAQNSLMKAFMVVWNLAMVGFTPAGRWVSTLLIHPSFTSALNYSAAFREESVAFHSFSELQSPQQRCLQVVDFVVDSNLFLNFFLYNVGSSGNGQNGIFDGGLEAIIDDAI
jgi:hypothetical protein